MALRDIGMALGDLDKAADIVVGNPYWNPRPIDREARGAVLQLLHDAFHGVRPA